jgi:hypothetical protein
MGCDRTGIQLFGYLATGYQHRHDHRHLSDGLSHPIDPEPRFEGDSSKLDELLRAITKARTGMVGLEHMSEEELKQVETEFASLRARQAHRLEATKPKTHLGQQR